MKNMDRAPMVKKDFLYCTVFANGIQVKINGLVGKENEASFMNSIAFCEEPKTHHLLFQTKNNLKFPSMYDTSLRLMQIRKFQDVLSHNLWEQWLIPSIMRNLIQ